MSGISEKNINKAESNEQKIERLEKELKFAKSQMARALSLYDEAKQEAERANKAKGEFISKLSHEFRTPMNALMGYSDILIRKNGDDETMRYTAGIKSATNRLLNLVNDLIEVTRIESGITVSNKDEYLTSVLLNSVIDGLYDSVTEKGLILNLNVQEDIPSRLFGDFYHLRQIICNILDNAVKYTEKGYIGIEIVAKKGLELNENGRKNIQIDFRIKDTGTGIRKKDQDKLFKSFSQFNSKNPYANQGVGIGLMVAKYYSNQMHGDITFESKYGEGSTFVCTVMQEIVDETPINSRDSIGTNIHKQIIFKAPETLVLVIDDSKVNLNVARGLLKSYDIDADIAEGGYEALKMVAKKKYDLIFMDHMMPGIDGIETMRYIRDMGSWCEKVPIVALTANATDEARNLFRMEGMQDFLAKPIELGLLRDILIKWLPKEKIKFGDVHDAYMEQNSDNILEEHTVFNEKRLAQENIDLKKGLAYFGGNLQAYKTTVSDICKDCSKKHIAMSNYYKDRDLVKFAIEAHSVKSVAASIGADTFSQKAKEMELKAKARDIAYIEENGTTFLKEYGEFIETLGKLLEEEAKHKGQKDNREVQSDIEVIDEPLMSEDEIKTVIEEALEFLCDFEVDSSCCKIKSLLGQKDKVDMIEKLYAVIDKIDDFEYEEAKEMLKMLRDDV